MRALKKVGVGFAVLVGLGFVGVGGFVAYASTTAARPSTWPR